MGRRYGLTFSVVCAAFAVAAGLAVTAGDGPAGAIAAVAGSGPGAAAATGAPALSATATSPVWAAEQLPGITTLDNNGSAQVKAVSCPAAGACGAGGFYVDGSDGHDQAFVVSSSAGGGWAMPRQVPGVETLNSGGNAAVTAISCSAQGDCGVSGYYSDSTGLQSFAGEESAGAWDGSIELPGSENSFGEPVSESCPAFARCTIGGFLTDTGGNEQPYVDDQGPGFSWRTEPLLTGEPSSGGGATVSSVSCKTAGNCTAGGWYAAKNGQDAFVSDEVNGSWRAAVIVAASLNKGVNAAVSQVSCAAPGDCAAVGGYAPAVNQQAPFVKDERNGKWLAAIPLPGTAALNTGHYGAATSVSCTAPGDCTAEGYYYHVSKTKAQLDFVATEKNWTWGTAIPVPGMAALNTGFGQPGPVSCVSPGTCSAAGEYQTTGGHLQVWSDSERGGKWATALPLSGLISLNAGESQVNGLSCAAVASCGMVGYYVDSHGAEQPFVATGAIAAATTVSEKLSAPAVVYGHEQAQRVSVVAASQFGAHPTGTVAVKAGNATACVITLKAGKGSCLVPAAKFGAGPVTVTAFYGGTVQFLGSKSAPATFTVAKAATRTGLALSASTIKFGHEQAEHLSVSEAPQFGGVPAGTVTVAAGTATVCVIKLKAGKGSCTLSPTRLKAGTYHLIASYHGGKDFHSSSSPPKTLTVTS